MSIYRTPAPGQVRGDPRPAHPGRTYPPSTPRAPHPIVPAAPGTKHVPAPEPKPAK